MSASLRRLEYRRARLAYHGGGEAVHQAALAARLPRLGVATQAATLLYSDLAREIDVLHVWGLQDPRESVAALRWAADRGVPSVLTAVLGDQRRRGLCMPLARAWLQTPPEQRLPLAAELAREGRLDELSGVAEEREQVAEDDRPWRALRDECLRLADRICCLSAAEGELLRRDFDVPPRKLAVTPVGTEVPALNPTLNPAPNPPQGAQGAPFVLVPASRIEPLKNQLAALIALSGFPHRVVVTGEALDREYASACTEIAGPHVEFAGILTAQQLWERMAAARVILHPSHLECASLTVLEAAAIGHANVVTTFTGSEREYLGDGPRFVDSVCPAEIRGCVEKAWDHWEGETERRAALRERARCYTWDAAATATADALRTAAQCGPKPQLVYS